MGIGTGVGVAVGLGVIVGAPVGIGAGVGVAVGLGTKVGSSVAVADVWDPQASKANGIVNNAASTGRRTGIFFRSSNSFQLGQALGCPIL